MSKQSRDSEGPQQFDRAKLLKLRDIDVERLDGLQAVLGRDQSTIIRDAIKLLAEENGIIVDTLETFLAVDLPDELRERMAEWRRELANGGVDTALDRPAAPWLTLAYLEPLQLRRAKERLELLQLELDRERPLLAGLPFNVQLAGLELSSNAASGKERRPMSLTWKVLRGRGELNALEAELQRVFPSSAREGRRRWAPGRGVWICHVPPDHESRVWALLEEKASAPCTLPVTSDAIQLRIKVGGRRFPPSMGLDPWVAKVWPDR